MKTSWIPEAVIYQVNLRSLAAREPRNAIEAAREKPCTDSPLVYLRKNLSTLKKLGVNVLHIMPPYTMGWAERKGIGSPYAARDYHSVDLEYGTLADFRDLVTAAHAKKFKVIVGMVPNHTSRDHVWVHQHPEFYVKNVEGEISYDLDWSDTAKLDYTQPGLRQAMIDAYRFWLNILGSNEDGLPDGVDGFRIDMAHFINDRSFWDEALPILKQENPYRDLLFLAECYGLDNSLDLFERGFNGAYDDRLYKVWELFYGVDTDGYSRLVPNPDLPHMDGFKAMHDAWQVGGIAGVLTLVLNDYEECLPGAVPPAFFARYTDNHDEGRGVYRFGPGAVRAMNILIFLTRAGLPFLLTGEEFGAVNRPSIHERIGPCDKGYRMLRPDQSVAQREGVEFEGNLFARGFENRQQWYTLFKDLIRLRKKNRALVYGSFELMDLGEQAAPEQCSIIAFERKYRGTRLRCAVNMGPEDRTLSNPELLAGEPLFGALRENILPSHSGVVVRMG